MTTKKRVLIIGGVAGGASAAARARRLSETAEIILFERGEYISFANCGLPYHIGGIIDDREALLIQTPKKMRQRFNIDVRINSEVTAINKEKKEITILDKINNKKYNERYDSLILSPGAQPFRPPIPGIEHDKILSLRNIPDMDKIINLINNEKPSKAVVVGGGYIGLEMAENLRDRNLDVTLVELSEQVMSPIDKEMATLLHQELLLNKVNLRLKTSVTRFNHLDNQIETILSSGEKLLADLVILAIGVKPETQLAIDSGLKIGKLGGILVNDQMQTSVTDIYAVGDAIEVKDFVSNDQTLVPLAGPANRQGRIAADNIFGRNSSYKQTQGTGICKVFNLAAGITGLNEKILQKKNIAYEKIYIHPANHASYYPGATPISLKLLFTPNDGKILGAQAIGLKDVDKKIDVLATSIRAGLTVFDLEEAELCYAPPYGSAKDAINYAGFVAGNTLRNDVKLFYAENIDKLTDKQMLLDVRTPEEVSAGTINNAINIPIDNLRERISELPKNKELIVFCKVGLRGYIAARILTQHGFLCRNLSGGYTTYLMVSNNLPQHLFPTELHEDTGETDNHLASITEVVKTVDARGLACPGPIQKLKASIDAIKPGETIAILTTDPGFVSDAPAWCHTTGNTLVDITSKDGAYQSIIRKNTMPSSYAVTSVSAKNMTIVVFSNDFDRAIAAFIIANGAATMSYNITLFFTFWGLNILRKDNPGKLDKNIIERIFGFMMPRGANKLALSKMNMFGIGKAMIKKIMRKHNITSLPKLIEEAKKANINLVACAMTMNLMGITSSELIDGVEQGGVAMYLDKAGEGNINLFI